MIFRRRQKPGTRTLTVCPSLTDERYLLTLHQLSDNLVRGCIGSFFLDHGENFVQTRAYQGGDASNSIDWKASARAQSLIVKEHESLRQTAVTLVVDRSGSMTSGSLDTSKYAAACALSGSLALAAIKTGCPARLVLSDTSAFAQGTLSTQRLASDIAAMRRFPDCVRTPLSRCLHEGFLRSTRRQLVFVLSDFHDACAGDALALLARTHEVILIRFQDPLEEHTPWSATLRLQPAEGGAAQYARGQNLPTCRAAADIIARLGLPTVTMDPAQPVSGQMRQFLALYRHG